MRIRMFPLVLALLGMTCLVPQSGRAIEVLAPIWAQQVTPGLQFKELRTLAGKQYLRVTVEALDNQQIQFTHTNGRTVEWLVNIIDPSNYANMPAPRNNPPQPAQAGPLAAMMTAQGRATTGVDKLDDREQSILKNWLLGPLQAIFPTGASGTNKLERHERTALSAWLNQKRQEIHPNLNVNGGGSGGGGISGHAPIHLPVHSSLMGYFVGFKHGRVYNLQNGQAWEQIDNTVTMRSLPGTPVPVTIRASGNSYIMSVSGAGEVMVKPVR